MARKRHDDEDERRARERAVSPESGGAGRAERDEDAALRPRSFAEFVGQRKIADNLAVYVQAARKRGDALDHVLLSGPPGLGKTTLAYLLAREMGTEVRVTSGPALERKGDLAGILTSLGRGDVLFIDEIHRLQPVIEESLYPAMEDFRIELVTGTGAGARAITAADRALHAGGRDDAHRAAGLAAADRASASSRRSSSTTPDELTTIVQRSARAARHPDRRRGRRGDRPARARHAARRQPPAAPHPRLRRGARRRPHHARGRRVRARAGWRSTRSGSTPATARSWRRSSSASTAARSASIRWPRRWPRIATRSSTSTSRT